MNIATRKILVSIINFTGSLTVGGLKFILRKKTSRYDEKKIKNILVISLHKIGDVIFTTPSISALRKKFPNAYIAVWVKSRGEAVIKNNPDINEVLVFDEVCTDRTREKLGHWKKKIEFAKYLRTKQFDLIIDLSGVLDSILIGMQSKAKYRIGFSTQGLGFLFDKEVMLPNDEPLITRYNRVLKALDISVDESALSLVITDADENKATQFLKQHGVGMDELVVGIHPGAGWITKCWFPERFAELAERLMKGYNLKVILVGSEKEIAVIEDITNMMKQKPLICAGELTLNEFAALLKRCCLFIGNDSAPAHIAGLLRIPRIVLFGSTNPDYHVLPSKKTVVIQKKTVCSPGKGMLYCNNRAAYPCKHRNCMKFITVDEVVKSAVELLRLNHEEN